MINPEYAPEPSLVCYLAKILIGQKLLGQIFHWPILNGPSLPLAKFEWAKSFIGQVCLGQIFHWSSLNGPNFPLTNI